MKNRAEIGLRMKKLRQRHNFSQTHVASVLFISQAAYSLIENSQNGIVVDHIIKLSKLYNVTTDYILTGNKNLLNIGRKTGFIPLLTSKNHTNFLEDHENDDLFDIKDWFRIPGFNSTEDKTLFKVEGESMSPTIFPGDILICQLHHNLDQVLDGSAVVVVTEKGIMVKRLRKDADPYYLILENDNNQASVENLRVQKQEIRKIMMIRGKISGVLVPHQEITGNGKLKELEENVKMLKKELYHMNKKLAQLSSRN